MSSPVSGRPLPSSFDEDEHFHKESGFQKVLTRMKREPLVPLGCILTTAAFTNAYRAMRKGDHAQVQRMFRARVLAQGFTIVAIVAGGLYFGAERTQEREAWKALEDQKAEEKRQRWIRELEARDEEEKDLKARMEKRREKKKAADVEAARQAFRAAEDEAKAQGDDGTPPAETGKDKPTQSLSGWDVHGWFGGSNSKGS